jgi:hypothetical protein
MAKKKEESAASAAMDVEASASQVISRLMGFGGLEADMVLKPISEQDRQKICEAYTKGDVDTVFAIVGSYSTYVED